MECLALTIRLAVLLLVLVRCLAVTTLPCSSGTFLISSPGDYLLNKCINTLTVNVKSDDVNLVMLNSTFSSIEFLVNVANISLTVQNCVTSVGRTASAPTIISFVGDIVNSSIAVINHTNVGGNHFLGSELGNPSNTTILLQDSTIKNTLHAAVYFNSASTMVTLIVQNCKMSFIQSDNGNWIRFDSASNLQVSIISTVTSGNGVDCLTSVGASFSRVSFFVYNSSIQCYGAFINALTLALSTIQVLSSTIDAQQGVIATNNNNAVTLSVDQSVFRLRGAFATASNILNRIRLVVSCSIIEQTTGDVIAYGAVDRSTIVFSGSTVTTSNASNLVSASSSMYNSSILLVRTFLFSSSALLSIPSVNNNNNFTSFCSTWWNAPVTKAKNVASRIDVAVLSNACGRLKYRCASSSTTVSASQSEETSNSPSPDESASSSSPGSKSWSASDSLLSHSPSGSSHSESFTQSWSHTAVTSATLGSRTLSHDSATPSASNSTSSTSSPSTSLTAQTVSSRSLSRSQSLSQSTTLKHKTASAEGSTSVSMSWAHPILIPLTDLPLSTAQLAQTSQSIQLLLLRGQYSRVPPGGRAGCVNVDSCTPLNATLVRYGQSAVLNVSSAAEATLEFPRTDVFVGVNVTVVVMVISLRPECLLGPYATSNITVPFEYPAPPPSQALTQTQTAVSTAAVAIATFSANAGVAIQADRSTLAFSVQFCRPQGGSLDFMDSPIPLAIGTSEVQYYAGGMITNVCIVVGFLLLVFIASLVASRWTGSVIGGMTRLRCPSVVSVPLMILLQPTTTCAMVTAIRGEQAMQWIAIGLLSLCGLVPVLYGLFLHEAFAASPAEYALARSPPSMLRSLKIFIFGTTKWKDSVEGSGFAQRHRLFFVDYRGQRHWFIVVEMCMCIACGGMEGLKLGAGRCGPVLIALVAVSAAYLAAVVALRPFDAPYSNGHTILLCTLQVVSAACVLVNQLYGYSAADDVALWSTSVSLYLVMTRAAVDLIPLGRRLYIDCFAEEEEEEGSKGLHVEIKGEEMMLQDPWVDLTIELEDLAKMDAAVTATLQEQQTTLTAAEIQDLEALRVRLYLPGCEAEAFGELAVILSSSGSAALGTTAQEIANRCVSHSELQLRSLD